MTYQIIDEELKKFNNGNQDIIGLDNIMEIAEKAGKRKILDSRVIRNEKTCTIGIFFGEHLVAKQIFTDRDRKEQFPAYA